MVLLQKGGNSRGPHVTIAPRGTEALVIGDASHMHRDLRRCVQQQRNDGGRTMQLILCRGEVSPGRHMGLGRSWASNFDPYHAIS